VNAKRDKHYWKKSKCHVPKCLTNCVNHALLVSSQPSCTSHKHILPSATSITTAWSSGSRVTLLASVELYALVVLRAPGIINSAVFSTSGIAALLSVSAKVTLSVAELYYSQRTRDCSATHTSPAPPWHICKMVQHLHVKHRTTVPVARQHSVTCRKTHLKCISKVWSWQGDIN